jgi:hypothetical protein
MFPYGAGGSGAECKSLNRWRAGSIRPDCYHRTVPCASPGSPIPEAIDLIARSSIDGFANFEAIAQCSIHADSSRSCMCARTILIPPFDAGSGSKRQCGQDDAQRQR